MLTQGVNNAGSIVSKVIPGSRLAPSFAGEKYSATAYVYDTEMEEWVSFYWLDKPIQTTDGGAQCEWIKNNAHADDPDQFGIKLTSLTVGDGTVKSAAFAMYQRQQRAAEEGFAPPVHGMCCAKYYDKGNQRIDVYWGYLSCVADMDGCPTNPDAEYEYEQYCDQRKALQDCRESIANILDNESAVTGRQMRNILEAVDENLDCPKYTMGFNSWCAENGHELVDTSDLSDELCNISLIGLQNDWHPVGYVFEYGSKMGGDLHANNVGMWDGRLVCIDFGYHSVMGERYANATKRKALM